MRRFVRWFLELLYTDLAGFYDLVANLTSVGQWWRWQQVVESRLPAGRLLEVGHGTGRLLERQLASGRAVIGIDRSRSMSRITSRRLRKARLPQPLVRADARALPFAGRSFDGAYATFPSEYIADPNTTREVLRVIKPGARLLIVPYAWITGPGLLDRLADGLYRLTGQSATPGDLSWPPIKADTADVKPEVVSLERADVLLLSVSAKSASGQHEFEG